MDEFPVSMLHGKLDVEDRDRVIDAFRKGKSRVLVTTNVIARGIDVLQVSLVINYDIPVHKAEDKQKNPDATEEVDTETFIHRVGRTARFGRSGVALTLLDSDADEDKLTDILCIIGCDSTSITPEKLGDIELLLKHCRDEDQKNLERLGLEHSALPSVEAKDTIVPESHRGKHNKKAKAETAASPAAAPDPASSAAAPAPSTEDH